MIKKYYRRSEGPHDSDGLWQRHNNGFLNMITEISYQDRGETIKQFNIPGIYIRVQLCGNTKCYVGERLIEYPTYFAPEFVDVGDIVYVPIGDSRFNMARVISKIAKPKYNVRAIDNIKKEKEL